MSDYIVTHPENVEALRVQLLAGEHITAGSLVGIPVVGNPSLPRHPSKFTPPAEPFIDYGPEDERWLRFFGYGRVDIDTSALLFYRMRIPVFSDFGARFMRDSRPDLGVMGGLS